MGRWLFICMFFTISLFGVNLKSFLTYTFDANKEYDMQKARDLYFKNKCNACHGDNAEKITVGSRALRDMTPEQIKGALIGYTLDGSTSVTASQMALYAKKLSHAEMDEIIAYIKGGNFASDLQVKDLFEEEPSKKTKNGIFIK